MHAVVRTDLMTGTDVGADLRSLKYMGTGTTATDIDNGCVVKLDSLMTGEREIWKGVKPAANTALKDVVLVATPEILYDERLKDLKNFYNEAGKAARGYVLHTNNIFSVTEEALALTEDIDDFDDVVVGNTVELQADVKLLVGESVTSGSTAVGKIIAIEKAGRYTYYVIEVD